ncbi:MAG: methyltransferase domain-containing protein [Pyrinomonadaceae bacterium]
MKERLLQLLACPSCEGDIRLTSVAQADVSRGWREIVEGELSCAACARAFPVRRGVPRFADVEEIEAEKAATAENFGWQWRHFTQGDERYGEQFLGWITPVAPEFFRDKLVLEGGCGKGRHTRLAARWGAREVVGVDLSDAVETAYAATRDLANAHIIQADIYHLPLKHRSFDYAFSVGVLHHLPRPRAGFVALSRHVKDGGHLSAWVYGAENNEWITRFVSPVREHLTSRMSRDALLHLSKLPAAALYAATKLVYAPLNRRPSTQALARRLFYNDYLNHLAQFGWREQHTIVFDHLVAPTAFYVARAEFEDWWREIGADDVRVSWHNRNSWCGFGKISRGQGSGNGAGGKDGD